MPGISRLTIVALCIAAAVLAGCAGGVGGTPGSGTPDAPPPRVIVGVDAEHRTITEPLREVVPPRGPDDASLALSYATTASQPPMLGIEGWIGFLQATDPQGNVILDARVTGESRGFSVPPGPYRLRAYYRTCDGNCGTLDPPVEFCSLRGEVVAGRDYQLIVMLGPSGSAACRFDR